MTIFAKLKSMSKRRPLIDRTAYEIPDGTDSASALLEHIVRKNENSQNADEAVKNALQSFSDGLFRLYVNDEELAPGARLSIKDGDEVTFIRLTMLSGRLW